MYIWKSVYYISVSDGRLSYRSAWWCRIMVSLSWYGRYNWIDTCGCEWWKKKIKMDCQWCAGDNNSRWYFETTRRKVGLRPSPSGGLHTRIGIISTIVQHHGIAFGTCYRITSVPVYGTKCREPMDESITYICVGNECDFVDKYYHILWMYRHRHCIQYWGTYRRCL